MKRGKVKSVEPCAYHDPLGKECTCIRAAVSAEDVAKRQRAQAAATAWETNSFKEYLQAIREYKEAAITDGS